jgi:hypothetical protein
MDAFVRQMDGPEQMRRRRACLSTRQKMALAFSVFAAAATMRSCTEGSLARSSSRIFLPVQAGAWAQAATAKPAEG